MRQAFPLRTRGTIFLPTALASPYRAHHGGFRLERSVASFDHGSKRLTWMPLVHDFGHTTVQQEEILAMMVRVASPAIR